MQILEFVPKDHFLKVLIYGPSWAGKTTLASTAPDVLRLSAEHWLLSIREKKPKYIKIDTLEDIREAWAYLNKWDHKYKTVVIDSITEINDLIKLNIEKKLNRQMGIPERTELAKIVEWLLRGFVNLNMHVVFLAHELIEYDDKGKVIRIVPSLNWKLATKIAAFMDTVAYMNVDQHGSRKITVTSQSNLITKDRTKFITNDMQDLSERIKRLEALEVWEEAVILDEKVDVPDEVPQVTGTPTAPTTPSVPSWVDTKPTEAELQRHLVKTLRDKFSKKMWTKAGTVMADWLKNMYWVDKSMALNIDQLNEMHQIVDTKTEKEIEDYVLNHDARKAPQEQEKKPVAKSDNTGINNIANDISS